MGPTRWLVLNLSDLLVDGFSVPFVHISYLSEFITGLYAPEPRCGTNFSIVRWKIVTTTPYDNGRSMAVDINLKRMESRERKFSYILSYRGSE